MRYHAFPHQVFSCISTLNRLSLIYLTAGSNESVIPEMIYGDPQTINLNHPVLFASTPSDISTRETDLAKKRYSCYCLDGLVKYRDERLPLGRFNLIDPNAFVGMAKNIGIMIRQMRTLEFVYAETHRPGDDYLKYRLASDCKLRSLVRIWAYQNSAILGRHEAAVDTDYRYFKDMAPNENSRVSSEEYPYSYYGSPQVEHIVSNVFADTQKTRRVLHQVLLPPVSDRDFFTVNESVKEVRGGLIDMQRKLSDF